MSAHRRTTVEDDSAPAVPRPADETKRAKPTSGRPAAERPGTERRPAGRLPAGKPAPAARPSLFATRTASLRELYRDTMSEMRKITWPDQETTRNLTIVVIGISVVLGILLGGIDFLLVKLLELF